MLGKKATRLRTKTSIQSLTVGSDFNVPLLLDGGHHFVLTGSNNTQGINDYEDEEGMLEIHVVAELLDGEILDFDKAITYIENGMHI